MKPNSLHCGDCLELMRSMPDKSVDLVCTSPPYEVARTYSVGFNLRGQDWVDWMFERIREMCRVCKGLVMVNCEGQTRDFRWSATPVLLMADLHRAGFNLRKPAIFHRIGVPGSGGPDWLRNDWEACICITPPGKLPWSDNTAMGHPPKWAPGGEMSNRLSDGTRVNQWGHPIDSGATVVAADGTISSKGTRPSHKLAGRDQWGGTGHASSGQGRKTNGEFKTRTRTQLHNGRLVSRTRLNTETDGSQREQGYTVPCLANPGNVIEQEEYDAEAIAWELIAQMMTEATDVNKYNVGGGVMGSNLCHENEAPYPEDFAEFWVKSFCPEGGTVLDPFCGSGTTLAVAERWGRKWIGFDLRESQIALSKRRIKEVHQPLFAEQP